MPAKLLIVDDEAIVAESMRVVLTQLGYDVVGTAGSVSSALQLLQSARPDLVLMDINLGHDQEGIATAATIRDQHRLPVVYVTAYGDNATLARAKITHPFGYVTKPFESRDLQIAIEIALHNHGLEQRLLASERALGEQAETHRTLLSTTLDGVIETDENATILDVNQAYQELTGYARAELVGMSIRDLEANEAASEVDAHTSQIRREGGDRFESRHRAKDGRLIDVEVSITYIASRRRFLAFFRDISERKAIERTLRFLATAGAVAGEDFFVPLARFLAAELGMDYVCIDRLETDGLAATTLAVYSNGRFEDNLTYALKDTPCGDVVGQTVCCFPAGVRQRFPRDAALEELQAESYVGVTLRGHDDRPIGLIAVIGRRSLKNPALSEKILQLVTGRAAGELVRAQAALALQESEYNYRSLMDQAADGIFIADPQGRYLDVNRAGCELLGRSREELLQLSMGDVVTAEDQKIVPVADRLRELNAGRSIRSERRMLRKDGTVVTVEISARQLADGRLQGIHRDVTERRRAEEELRRISRWLFATQRISATGGWAINLKTATVWASPEARRIYGFSDGELSIPAIQSFPLAPYRPVLDRALKALIAEGEPYDVEFQVTRGSDGTTVDIRSVAEYNAEENLVLGVVQDITERKRAEAALQESAENFQTFFETIQDLVVVASLDGRILYANRVIERKLGYSAEDVAAMKVLDLHPLELRKEAEEIFAAMFRGERAYCPLPIRAKDGRLVPVETRVWIGRWNGAECIFGLCKDLSAEQEAQQRFERLFRHNPALMALTDVENNHYCDVNDAFLSTLGFSRDEVIGRTMSELGLTVSSEQMALGRKTLQLSSPLRNFEMQIRCKDGTLLTGLFSGDVISTQGRDYFITVMIDVTAQKRTEQALLESEAKFRSYIDHAPVGVVVADGNGRHIDANRAAEQMLGYEPGGLLGTFVNDMPVPEDAEAARQHSQQVVSAGVADGEFRLRHRSGSAVWVGVRASKISDTHFLAVYRDITERKRLETERESLLRDLARKNRELENLVYVTSHDLRSPMLNIQGFAQRIEERCLDLIRLAAVERPSAADRAELAGILTQQLPKALGYVRTSVDKMDRLIGGLLRLSRLGRAGLHPENLDLNAMLRDIRDAMAFPIQTAGVAVEVASLPPCHGDAGQINQVFTNLLDNALKYRDPARPLRITVTGRVEGARAIYCVADTGQGIAAKHRNKVWEIFFRAHPAGPAQGEGIGLNLVRRIVERHQGEIWFESTEGEGSSFYVALPRTTENTPAHETESKPPN